MGLSGHPGEEDLFTQTRIRSGCECSLPSCSFLKEASEIQSRDFNEAPGSYTFSTFIQAVGKQQIDAMLPSGVLDNKICLPRLSPIFSFLFLSALLIILRTSAQSAKIVQTVQ